MTTNELIKKLQHLDYEISVSGDKIRCVYKGQKTPDIKKIQPIIEEIKKNKDEIISHLKTTQETSQDVVSKVLTMFDGKIIPEGLTQRDIDLDKEFGKPCSNPKNHKCIRCGNLGERYCLGQDTAGVWWWSWQCLRCRPHSGLESN